MWVTDTESKQSCIVNTNGMSRKWEWPNNLSTHSKMSHSIWKGHNRKKRSGYRMNNTWSVPVGARLKCWRTLTRRGHHRIWTLDTGWQRNLWDAWKVHWGLSELSLHGNDGNKGEGWCRGSYQRALVLPFHLFCQAGAAGLGSRPQRAQCCARYQKGSARRDRWVKGWGHPVSGSLR